MGYFGKLLICVVWFFVVLFLLVLNYFGQGVLLLKYLEVIKNLFFLLVFEWVLILMLIIVMLVMVIVFQVVIFGVFFLICQVVCLGYLLLMCIIYILEMEFGQIYILFINWLLYVFVVIVIVSFEYLFNLVVVYGIVVMGIMVLIFILLVIVVCKNWYWNKLFVGLMLVVFLCIDILLFLVNFDKIVFGGWLLLFLGMVMFMVMMIWKSECFCLLCWMYEYGNLLEVMIFLLEKLLLVCVLGIVVYMFCVLNVILFVLLYNLKYNKVLYE